MLPEPVFDVNRVLARVAAENVTVLPGPPTLYQSILDHPQRAQHDLSSLRVAVTGCPRDVISRLPGVTSVRQEGESAFLEVDAGAADSVLRRLLAAGEGVHVLEVRPQPGDPGDGSAQTGDPR